MNNSAIVIDLFAGPGGLGEGFSGFRTSPGNKPGFDVRMSVEMEASAHATLTLRAFVRQFADGPPPEYYDFIASGQSDIASLYRKYPEQHAVARQETMDEPTELGGSRDKEVIARIKQLKKANPGRPFVVIGGPPCQAYSVAGRARTSKTRLRNSNGFDHRELLYLEYLEVLKIAQPEVFVMENVRGILSAKVFGKPIFPEILADLACPGTASGPKYRIYSLAKPYDDLDETGYPEYRAPEDFLICAEDHGIPQRRHRVILLGIREDIEQHPATLPLMDAPHVDDVIRSMPPLRSGVSRGRDSEANWAATLTASQQTLVKTPSAKVTTAMREWIASLDFDHSATRTRGSLFVPAQTPAVHGRTRAHRQLKEWIVDERLGGVANHQARSHMPADFARYLYCAAFAANRPSSKHFSPKSKDFPGYLAPKHTNWASGTFADRFRVQADGSVATTVTSHISKDGHYYIHWDGAQCRSLTVREAARIQTFPDNYVFLGNRTQQYVQVGNAVPPLLAREIAGIVNKVLS